MTKVVINACFGGFGLSPFGVKEYYTRKGFDVFFQRNGETASIENLEGFVSFDCYSKDPRKIGRNEDKYEYYLSYYEIPRDDEILIQIIEEYGSDKISGICSDLKIVDIPDDVEWEISDYDGNESVEELHRSWD